MTDERKGAPSASKCGALALCPGREKMEKGLPDQRSSDAQRGDVLHDAMYGKDVELSPDDVDLVRRMHEEEVRRRREQEDRRRRSRSKCICSRFYGQS